MRHQEKWKGENMIVSVKSLAGPWDELHGTGSTPPGWKG